MAILCMVCVWHAIVPLLAYDMPMARRADIYAFVVLAGLYLSFNVIFFTWSKCLVSAKSLLYCPYNYPMEATRVHIGPQFLTHRACSSCDPVNDMAGTS